MEEAAKKKTHRKKENINNRKSDSYKSKNQKKSTNRIESNRIDCSPFFFCIYSFIYLFKWLFIPFSFHSTKCNQSMETKVGKKRSKLWSVNDTRDEQIKTWEDDKTVHVSSKLNLAMLCATSPVCFVHHHHLPITITITINDYYYQSIDNDARQTEISPFLFCSKSNQPTTQWSRCIWQVTDLGF